MQTNPLHVCKCADGTCTCSSFEKDTALDARVDGIYRVMKGRIQLDNLVSTCIEVAKEIENIDGMQGKEKLDLLQKVLYQAIKDSSKTAEEKEQLIHVVETVVPIIVKTAVLASKSPIMSQVQVACVGCWTKTKRS